VAATNVQVREVVELGQALEWPVSVIDIQEIAQRNLQTAAAARDDIGSRASAALVVTADRQALFTISANGELFYSRRLDLPEGFLAMQWSGGEEVLFDDSPISTQSPSSYMPVNEYVPDYAGSTSYDYGSAQTTSGSADSGRERSQRLLVEVQRSLDMWERSWSALPLAGMRVYAGERTLDLSAWLSQELGQAVLPMEFASIFSGLEDVSTDTLMVCLPLLGTLLRTGSAKN
jgi:MSHA biogenesis protein MshI